MASSRNPSTPISSQRFITWTSALNTRGLSKLRSGWCEPQRGGAEILQIVELLGQPGKIANAVIVAVVKRLDVELVDDGVLVPKLVRGGLRRWHRACSFFGWEAADLDRREGTF